MVIGLANGISRQSLKLLRRHQEISPLSFPSTDMAKWKESCGEQWLHKSVSDLAFSKTSAIKCIHKI